MAIPNELSSEIAVAMLAKKKSPQELKKLKDIVLRVHGTLQELSGRSVADRTIASAQAADRVANDNP